MARPPHLVVEPCVRAQTSQQVTCDFYLELVNDHLAGRPPYESVRLGLLLSAQRPALRTFAFVLRNRVSE
jgi:hypothetical protein